MCSSDLSHQEQVFKDSLIRNLVKVCGFNTILLEANSKAVQPLNSYIQSDTTVDIRNEMIRDYRLYWVWKTDEYVELLDWIKQYNKNTRRKVQLVGIDVNDNSVKMRDSLMAVNVKYTMGDSLNSKAILLAHDSHIAGYDHSDFISMGGYLKECMEQTTTPLVSYLAKEVSTLFLPVMAMTLTTPLM